MACTTDEVAAAIAKSLYEPLHLPFVDDWYILRCLVTSLLKDMLAATLSSTGTVTTSIRLAAHGPHECRGPALDVDSDVVMYSA